MPPDLKKELPLERTFGQKVVEATVIMHYRTALVTNNCRAHPYLPRENLRHQTAITRLIFGGFEKSIQKLSTGFRRRFQHAC